MPLNEEQKVNIKGSSIFLLVGLLIQLILYKLATMCLDRELYLKAEALAIALTINSIVFLIGCFKIPIEIFKELRKGKNEKDK